MLISISSRTWYRPTLPKVPKSGSMTMVLLGLTGQQTVLTRTYRESMGSGQARRQLSKLCHEALMQYFMQKEPQPSTECREMNILFRSKTFVFKSSFFYYSDEI
ncbi:hypothetical protein XENORESO_003264 [Xenotaenia resolanae]|uniref:Uncharacterized protein n=1 Tax=Xenotaenia resolanae TaxID=208358 RepID=A0ABV0X0T7_9TELE